MKKKIIKTLKREKKIIKIIWDLDLPNIKKKFIFKVKIAKQNYLDMIKKRYISTLLTMSEKELYKGIEEINLKYAKKITFKDKLTCVIL